MNRTELCSQQTDFNIWEQISAFLIPRTLFFGRTSPATGPCHHLQNEVLTNLHPALSVRFSRQCETGSTTYHILAIRRAKVHNWPYCPCLRSSVSRTPRLSSCCVAASRSEPNWANAATSRYWASSNFIDPATCVSTPTNILYASFTYIEPHMPIQRCWASHTGPVFSLGHSQACTHRLWPAAIQPYIALVCHSNALYHANTFTNSFTKSRWMEGWVGLIFTDHHTCTSHDINIILFIKPCGKKIDWRDIYNV